MPKITPREKAIAHFFYCFAPLLPEFDGAWEYITTNPALMHALQLMLDEQEPEKFMTLTFAEINIYAYLPDDWTSEQTKTWLFEQLANADFDCLRIEIKPTN